MKRLQVKCTSLLLAGIIGFATITPTCAAENVIIEESETTYDETSRAVTSDYVIQEEDTYTVTFRDFEGHVISTQTVKHANEIVPPAAPQVSGYEFTGYDTDLDTLNLTSDCEIKLLYTPVEFSAQETSDGVISAPELTMQNLSQTLGQYTIIASGNMPANTILSVTRLYNLDELAEEINDDTYNIQAAFDITLYSNGEIYQPVDYHEQIQISILNISTTDDNENLCVYRILDDEAIVQDDRYTEDDKVTMLSATTDSANEVVFETEHFTVFTVGGQTITTSDDAAMLVDGATFHSQIMELLKYKTSDFLGGLLGGPTQHYPNTFTWTTSSPGGSGSWISTTANSTVSLASSAYNVSVYISKTSILGGLINLGSTYSDVVLYADGYNKAYLNPDSSTMFKGWDGVQNIGFEHFDSTYVTNMSQMFYGNSRMTSFDLSTWDVSNVNNFADMFTGDTAVTSFRRYQNINTGLANSKLAKYPTTLYDLKSILAAGGSADNYSQAIANNKYTTSNYIKESDTTNWLYSSYSYNVRYKNMSGTSSISTTSGTSTTAKLGTSYTIGDIYGGSAKYIQNNQYFCGWATKPNATRLEVVYKPGDVISTGMIPGINNNGTADTFTDDYITLYAVFRDPLTATFADGGSFGGSIRQLVTGSGLVDAQLDITDIQWAGASSARSASAVTVSVSEDTATTAAIYADVITINGKKVIALYTDACQSIDTVKLNQNASHMFARTNITKCSCLNTNNYFKGNINTDEVNDYTGLFKNCTKLQSINSSILSGFYARTTESMFENCSSLTSIDMRGFNTCQALENMNFMFKGCTSLTGVTWSDYFEARFLIDAEAMYQNCTALSSVDLTIFYSVDDVDNLNTYNLCCHTGLTSVEIPECLTIISEGMFAECSSLTTIDGCLGTTEIVDGAFYIDSAAPVYLQFNEYKNLTDDCWRDYDWFADNRTAMVYEVSLPASIDFGKVDSMHTSTKTVDARVDLWLQCADLDYSMDPSTRLTHTSGQYLEYAITDLQENPLQTDVANQNHWYKTSVATFTKTDHFANLNGNYTGNLNITFQRVYN